MARLGLHIIRKEQAFCTRDSDNPLRFPRKAQWDEAKLLLFLLMAFAGVVIYMVVTRDTSPGMWALAGILAAAVATANLIELKRNPEILLRVADRRKSGMETEPAIPKNPPVDFASPRSTRG